MLGKKLGQSRIVGGYIHRPRLHLGEHAFVEVLDLKRHARRLARTLTTGKCA
jgi:hypothetical protein